VLVTLAAFIFVLGVLIFVHELGHFLAAKAVGIAVPRFSIGFGPATPLKFRRGETEYVVAWFPLGGYVKMASKEEQEAMAGVEGGALDRDFPPEQLFESKSLPARVFVISAGVVMNMLFAWLVYAGLAAVYGRAEDPTTTIGRVEVEGLPPAAQPLAAVPRGTQVIRVNGDTMTSWQQIMLAVTDPTSDRVRFDFAGGLDPVILPIRGTDMEARVAVATAIRPAWDPVAGAITPGFPADAAGLEPGDRLLAIDGDTVYGWYDIPPRVEPRAGDTLTLTVQRGPEVFQREVVPEAHTVPRGGEAHTVGQIGFGVPELEIVRVRFGLGGAVVEGATRTWANVELVLFTLKGIIFGDISAREVGGPVLIGQMSGQVARAGLVALFTFMALLSVNLAILNLLPIPVLDGGHLVFLAIEGVRGRPLSLQARVRLTQLGMVMLLALMALVFTNDIVRLIGG
jgi:regulator of sigma E protease